MTPTMLNRHGLLKPSAGYEELFAHQLEQVTALLDELVADVRAARHNPALSPIGVREAITRLGIEAGEALEATTTGGRRLFARDLSRYPRPQRLPTPAEHSEKTGTPLVALMAELAELRAHLRGLDPVLAELALDEAAAGDDVLLLLAATATHPRLRPAAPDVIERATAAWIDHHLPEGARPVAEAEATFNSNLQSARQLIAKTCGLPLPVHDQVALDAAGDEGEPAME